MLVVSRRLKQRIFVGQDVIISVVRIGPHSVRIGIQAPGNKLILREELLRGVEPAVGLAERAARQPLGAA